MSGNGNGNGVTAGTVTDDLIDKARAIASRSDELLKLLEDARQKLLNASRKPEAKRRFEPEPAVEPVPEPEPVPEQPAVKTEVSEGLRLLTTQMAAEGSSREEIADRLRDEFNVTNPEPILRGMGL